MTDFFDQTELKLIDAAARGAHLPWGRRMRRRVPRLPRRGGAIVLAGAVLLSVPAVARVTGAWDPTPAEPAPEAGIIAEPGEPLDPDPPASGRLPDEDVVVAPNSCASTEPPEGPATTSRPPDQALLDTLGMLRRQRQARDRLPPTFVTPAGPVHTDHVRLARTTASGGRYYLVPVGSVVPSFEVPDTPECERFRHPPQRARPGVCLHVVGDPAGGTCQTAAAIRDGLAMVTGDHIPTERRGTVIVAAIVPDGVTRVTLRYPKEAPVREVNEPVVGNVFTAKFNGSAAVMPRVFWHLASGEVREVRRPGR